MKPKQCLKCGIVKPPECFSPDRRRADWLQGQCKECRSADEKRRREATPPEIRREQNQHRYNTNRQKKRASTLAWKRANPERVRAYALRARYGLTPEDVNRMRREQNEECAVCKRPLTPRAHVDHCHKTGRVRGILCGGCNIVLGHIEKPGFLESALRYLGN